MLAEVSLSLRFGDIVNSDRSGGEYWVIRVLMGSKIDDAC